MFKFFPLVGKNLFRNSRRTILTVLSVAASLFLLGVLLTVYAAFYFRDTPADQAQRLITRHKVSLTQALPAYYGAKIESIPGVEAIAAMNWFGGIYKDNKPEEFFARFAVEPEQIFKVYKEFDVPPDQYQAFLDDRQGLAVGRMTADRVGLELGQRFTISGDIYPLDLELTVSAIFDGPDSDTTYFHKKYLDEGLPQGMKDMVGIYAIRTTSVDNVGAVARAVDAMFRNAPEPTKTETEAAFQLAFVNQIGNIKLFLLSIAGAVVFTIMLVSANTMAMSVRERIREVGVLKTLGFTSAGVLALILSEAALTALVGGALGVTGAMAAGVFLEKAAAGFFTGFRMPAWGVPVCLGASLVIGLGSSLIPAISASHTRITEALRHSG
ncbi:MAG: FtsX-like permease family protein [Bryobacterales bacterium]